MRILHVTNYLMDELSYQDSELPKAQSNLGHTVKIITSERYYPFEKYDEIYSNTLGDRIKDVASYCIGKLQVSRLKPIWERSSMCAILLNPIELYKQVYNFKPESIHLHGEMNFNLFVLLLYSFFHEVKLFVDVHADAYNLVLSRKALFMVRFFSFFYKIFDSKFSKFLPVTNASIEYLKCNFHIKKEKIELLPLGSSNKTSYISRELSNHKVVVIHSGKFYAEKRIIESIKLLSDLSVYASVNIEFILVGQSTNDDYDKLIDMKIEEVSDSNLSVKRYPFMSKDELFKLYQVANFGIWIGHASNSIQDLMSLGVPIILSESKAISHLTLNGSLAINLNNKDDAIERLSWMFTDNERYSTLSQDVINLMASNSWGSIANKAVSIYEKS